MTVTTKTNLLDEFAQDEPELYHLTLHIGRFPHGAGRWYHNVQLTLFRTTPIELPDKIVNRFVFGGFDEDAYAADYTAMYLGDSFFTAGEAESIERWLKRIMKPGDTFDRRRATFPVNPNQVSVSVPPCGGGVDHYQFWTHDSFDCPVLFCGHYDLRFSSSYLGCDRCGREVSGVPTVEVRSAHYESVFGERYTYCATCVQDGTVDIAKLLDTRAVSGTGIWLSPDASPVTREILGGLAQMADDTDFDLDLEDMP